MYGKRFSFGRTIGVMRLLVIIPMLLLLACQPHERTPGQWLRGEEVVTLPDDWSFTDQHQKIYVEVATPYFVPHSVTIWCAQVNGQLYIAARNPEDKQWVAWLDADSDIRLKISEKIYVVKAVEEDSGSALAPVRAAYASKYDLPTGGSETPPPMRYWRIHNRG